MKNKYNMRKKNIYMLLCAVFLLCSAMTCDDGPTYFCDIIVKNVSSDTIYVCGMDGNEDDAPFTIGKAIYYNRLGEKSLHELCVGEVYKDGGLIYDDKFISQEDISGHRYCLFVLKKSTKEKYSIEQIAEQNIYDKKYELTYNELRALNFQINYTGE